MGRPRHFDAILLTATVVLVVTAFALAVACFFVRQDASDARAQADRSQAVAARLAASENDAQRSLATLRGDADHVDAALGALMRAYQAEVESANKAVDAANLAADKYNTGQGPIADSLKTEAQAAVGDLDAKTAAVRTALVEAKAALVALRQVGG